jgi:hypothetical protein
MKAILLLLLPLEELVAQVAAAVAEALQHPAKLAESAHPGKEILVDHLVPALVAEAEVVLELPVQVPIKLYLLLEV